MAPRLRGGQAHEFALILFSGFPRTREANALACRRVRGQNAGNQLRKKSVNPEERAKVEGYLRTKFSAPSLEVRVRPRKTDSAEVYLGGEFLGVLSKDDEDGELCYHFAMTILDLDLEEGAGED
jgi:hypothetical protein